MSNRIIVLGTVLIATLSSRTIADYTQETACTLSFTRSLEECLVHVHEKQSCNLIQEVWSAVCQRHPLQQLRFAFSEQELLGEISVTVSRSTLDTLSRDFPTPASSEKVRQQADALLADVERYLQPSVPEIGRPPE